MSYYDDNLDEFTEDVGEAVGSFIVTTFMFMIVLVAVALFIYWKFTCWVAKQTNVNNCLTMFMIAILADSLLLKGNTAVAMLIIALIRIDLGNMIGSPQLASADFSALKSGKRLVTQPTTSE